ncbi:cytochrome P450 [Microdochium bolleyi]|uniref:Cytochrome P450 n=1 Tax=Microdochium bolleyi TaxID=196109 RepID=A0A136IXU7_9PEZI|nr:cytochrome P450 [Microdochium bolleyi]
MSMASPTFGLPLGFGTVWSSVLTFMTAWLAYQLIKALYNISPLHPLHHVPGPALAAATYLPEFYHDVYLGGRYTHAIQKMHDTYGPLVRVNPHEVHCNDMDFADEIYATGSRKRDKPMHLINGSSGGTGNTFGTPDHDLHRIRRVPVAKFFSVAMISQLESEVHALANKLCDKLLAERTKAGPARQPVDVAAAYSLFTTDAISSYSFGEPFGLLDQPGWTPNFRDAALAMLKPTNLLRFFPFLLPLADSAVLFVDYLPADVALLIRAMRITIPGHVNKTKADLDAGIRYHRPTVFGSLLESELPEDEKKPARLAFEANAIVGAGTETTSWALTVITFHLLDKPAILARLTEELQAAVPDPTKLPRWATLEALPYLGAVIQEGQRLSYGVSARSSRVPTQENLVYRGEWAKKPVEIAIPRGYAVGMSAAIAHHDEALYPDSHSFRPERWLLDDGQTRNRELERGLLNFSKGSRACLGKNLAMCELHLALAAVVLRVMPYMKLYETTVVDVAYDHDMFIPVVKEGSKGVRVTIE